MVRAGEAPLAYNRTAESTIAELGAQIAGFTKPAPPTVETTDLTTFWEDYRLYPSVIWETYGFRPYVWGRVRSILLPAWLLVLNTSGSLPEEYWGTKFRAPRRRRAGNAYVMTYASSVERVEVLAGVLIVLSISYGRYQRLKLMC